MGTDLTIRVIFGLNSYLKLVKTDLDNGNVF
jgi:hypothetical protein